MTPTPDVQPPPERPAEHVLRAESHFVTAARRDVPLVLTKDRRVENALVRYQIYIKTDVEARAPDDATPECVWILSTHLQRQLCFTSMTGQFACTDALLAEQADNQKGSVPLASDAEADGCGLGHPSVIEAEQQLSQAVGATAPGRFDADLKLNVTPQFVRAGATVKRGR